MYVAIRIPPRSGARLYSGGLVDVQHRSAEDEDRREDHEREHGGDPQGLAAPLAQREEDHETREEDRDRECREGAERVHVIGSRELEAATERVRVPTAFDERRRHAETDQRQPRQREQVDPREDP
jgi:hypothetical protein